uniref:non-specific serine/threonine protein kinase n=1 Tax=Angiostrongylus cantonensis TaxID=6313 RepID=A0A0K0DG35_ANGCA
MDSPPPSNFVILCESPRKPTDPNNNSSVNRASKIAARKTSRVYPAGFEVLRPRLVTGTNIPIDQIEKNSQIYRASQPGSYFEQCFRICRILGKGEFGEAVEVESLEDGRHYAIKRALRTFESSTSRQNKLREVLVHESIPHHANILRFEKAWEERGRLYIQTELCSGNLADYRRNFGLLTENELYLVLLSVLTAVEHLHSLNILHLDIKPSNILIHESGCKLGDFGLAYNLIQNPIGYGEEGDKYYMAPEILNNCPTTAADIYSVGNSPTDSSPSGVEDADWDFDITDLSSLYIRTKLLLESVDIRTNDFSCRSRLEFDEDDSDCGASKKLRRTTVHELNLFTRRLALHHMDTCENEVEPLKKRRLVRMRYL